MGYNFKKGHDPYQPWLMPPSYTEMLGENHLVFKLMETVDKMDTSALRDEYRADGKGAAAYDPDIMLAIILYGYITGTTSSRRMEAACCENLAFMALSRNSRPDHATLARARKRIFKSAPQLLGESIRLCAEAGLVDPSLIAIDGTKMQANASMNKNLKRDFFEDFLDWAREAERIDAEEDRIYGNEGYGQPDVDEAKLDSLIEAFNRKRAEVDRKVQQQVEDMAKRQAKEKKTGRKTAGVKPKPPAELREELESKIKVNRTDPDSSIVKGQSGYLQGYNPQVAVTTGQIIIGALVDRSVNDWDNLFPMTQESIDNLKRAGVEGKVETVVADAGYASSKVLAETESQEWSKKEITFYLPTKKERAQTIELTHCEVATGEPPEDVTDPRKRMEHRLRTEKGRAAFRQRAPSVEPVFAHIKSCRKTTRFSVRGLEACDQEWKLISSVHNLLKLMRYCPQLARS